MVTDRTLVHVRGGSDLSGEDHERQREHVAGDFVGTVRSQCCYAIAEIFLLSFREFHVRQFLLRELTVASVVAGGGTPQAKIVFNIRR